MQEQLLETLTSCEKGQGPSSDHSLNETGKRSISVTFASRDKRSRARDFLLGQAMNRQSYLIAERTIFPD
jgi:hypothetical protein